LLIHDGRWADSNARPEEWTGEQGSTCDSAEDHRRSRTKHSPW